MLEPPDLKSQRAVGGAGRDALLLEELVVHGRRPRHREVHPLPQPSAPPRLEVRRQQRQPHRLRCNHMKSLHAPSRWRTKGGRTEKEGIRTDEVHDESAVGEAPGGAAEVRHPVWRPAGLAVGVAWDSDQVAGVGERVAEAEDGGVAGGG